MKDLRLLLLIIFIAGLLTICIHYGWLKRFIPLPSAFRLPFITKVIDREPQFSYLPKNIIINVVIILFIFIITKKLTKKRQY